MQSFVLSLLFVVLRKKLVKSKVINMREKESSLARSSKSLVVLTQWEEHCFTITAKSSNNNLRPIGI